MRIFQSYHYWRSKKAVLLKVSIMLTCVYSLSLLTGRPHSARFDGEDDDQHGQVLFAISGGDLDGKKASLQLNWLRAEETGRNDESKQVPQIESVTNPDNEVNGKLNGLAVTKRLEIRTSGLITSDKSTRDIKTTLESYPQKSDRDNLKNREEKIREKITSNNRRYIFAFRYYEQLAMATNNLIALASLGKHFNRKIVMPFVNNSRMNGVTYSISKQRKVSIFADMNRYFDVSHVNATLLERGYSSMAHLSDFINDCRNSVDVLVHFIFNDTSAERDATKWFDISKQTWRKAREKSASNNGWTNCDFMKDSGMETLLEGATVKRYVCVDPERINTAEKLEKHVLKNARCVGIFQWKGNGANRTHFPPPASVLDHLRPSDLRHNKALVDIAKQFVERNLKRPFLAVHVRAERHLLWRGINQLLKCIKKLKKKITQRQATFHIDQIFIATDLPSHGSDTYHNKKWKERRLAGRYLHDTFNNPVVFDPSQYGIYDRGEVAIIEMNILSLGESLFTSGGGSFQKWIIDLFLLRNVEDSSLVQKVCLLG
eukprot:gene3689-4207_t